MMVVKENLIDPYSNPNNPRTISFDDIQSAYESIKEHITNTPCQPSRMSPELDMQIFLKKENLQQTGSVKVRGALYSLLMLSEEKKKAGVITASFGNHGEALCYYGYRLDIPVTVVMPLTVAINRISQCFKFNANVVVHGKDLVECNNIALKIAQVNGFTFIDAHDYPHVIAGQATLGLEIVNELQDFEALVVPVGGGGLIAGCGVVLKALKPRVKLIGVEPSNCAGFYSSWKAGKPTHIIPGSSIADALVYPTVGFNAFKTARHVVDRVVKVDEKWIALAILRIVEEEKMVIEGAGALPLAAILSGQLNDLKGKRVVLALTGGNIDAIAVSRILERGLAMDGRLLKITILVSDTPGTFALLLSHIAEIGASIKNFEVNRVFNSDPQSAEVNVICETREKEHTDELKALLQKKYTNVKFLDVVNS